MSITACVSIPVVSPTSAPSNPSRRLRRLAHFLTAAVAFGTGALVGSVADAQSYIYHELATIPGFANTSASGVNNLGQTVGWIHDPTTSSRLAVLWDAYAPNQPPVSLGVPPHSWTTPDVGARAINDHGEVIGVGKGVVPSGPWAFQGPYRWTSATGFVPLSPPAMSGWTLYSGLVPYAINCGGNVVGGGTFSSGYANGLVGLHWSPANSNAIVQSPPGGLQVYNFVALKIFGHNDLDHVVGKFTPSWYTPGWFQDQGHAFYWDSIGGYTTLSAGAFDGEAIDINNCEQVIGVVRFAAQAPAQTILWERAPNGTFSSIALPGLSSNPSHHTYPTAINDAGQAIGRAQVGSGQFAPVVWDLVNGTVTDLRPFLPAPMPGAFYSSMNVNDIGNDGTIVGRIMTTLTSGGQTTHTAFVLLPTTSPTILCPGSVCLPPPPPFDLLPPVIVYQDAIRHRVTFTVTGATPGQTVFIVDDTGGRYRQTIVGQCPIGLPPQSIVLAMAIVDPSGNATATVSFSSALSGSVGEYVAVEPGLCVFDAEFFMHP